jgi:hypothetical protein
MDIPLFTVYFHNCTTVYFGFPKRHQRIFDTVQRRISKVLLQSDWGFGTTGSSLPLCAFFPRGCKLNGVCKVPVWKFSFAMSAISQFMPGEPKSVSSIFKHIVSRDFARLCIISL